MAYAKQINAEVLLRFKCNERELFYMDGEVWAHPFEAPDLLLKFINTDDIEGPTMFVANNEVKEMEAKDWASEVTANYILDWFPFYERIGGSWRWSVLIDDVGVEGGA